MIRKGISRRWFINTIGIVFVILTVSIVTLSLMVQSSAYNGIELVLTGRVDELLNMLSGSSGGHNASEFTAITRDYIENFRDKNKIEIMALSKNGKVYITSTGFAPDQTQSMPDYNVALKSENNSGKWIGRLNTGEKVMAITRVVRDSSGSLIGSIRYMVSMDRADQQTTVVILTLVAVGLFIMLLITFSGMYFIRSIVTPIRQMSATAKQIAQGDFEVRIEKSKDDEIGQLCEAINDMASELGATERMKNDFISSVSHELRTPLTSIRGWVETLMTLDDPTDENYRKGLEIINNETGRLNNMVEELLDFSRLQNGRIRMECRPLDLVAELTDAVLFCEARIRQEGLLLHYAEPEEMIPVYADPDRLRQVFINILDNAIKYSAPGGRITVKLWAGEYKAFVEIIDQGRGIPPEDLENVKTKFYKGSNSVRGSGIGLALVDSIMTALDGTLDIKSTLGRGTVVTLGLPLYHKA